MEIHSIKPKPRSSRRTRMAFVVGLAAIGMTLGGGTTAFADADGDQDTGNRPGRVCSTTQQVYMWSTGTASGRRHYINNGQQIGYWAANTTPVTRLSHTGLVSIINYRVFMHRFSIGSPATLTEHGTACVRI